MHWLIIVVVAYLLNAVAMAIDKKLLNKGIPQPVVYTFYISLLGLLAIVLAPLGLQWIGNTMLWYSLLAGVLFTTALLVLFTAVSKDEVSRVTPVVGGFSPIFVFLLAYIFLGERLSVDQMVAFVLIVIGSILIGIHWKKIKQGHNQAFAWAILSALLFAASYALSKYVYDAAGFISGFIFIRLGAFIGAILLLIPPQYRQVIFKQLRKPNPASGNTSKWFLVGQGAGALSAVMVNWAISLGSVSLVNALQGLQYVFLFIIIIVVMRKYPAWLQEDLSRGILVQKVVAIIFIGAGLYMLAI